MWLATHYEIPSNMLSNHYVVCLSDYDRKRKALVFILIFAAKTYIHIILYVVLQVDFKCDVVLDTEPVTPKVVSHVCF